MDLDELLSYKPPSEGQGSSKRPRDAESDLPPAPKAPRRSQDRRPGRPHPSPDAGPARGAFSSDAGGRTMSDGVPNLNGVSDEEKLRILQSLDEDDEDDLDQGEGLDAGAVKRLLLSFEKKVLRNQEMRIKFPDLPEKFMESELELNDEIQKLHVIATVPEYYPVLIEVNTIQTLVGLLSHDNSDLSIAVIDLLQELTDVDTLNESEEEAERLIEALLREQVIALLVQNLERLDEKVREDADGVHNTLAIVENMSELKNTEVCTAAGAQGLLVWLLRRVRVRQYDANKLYAAEILAILLQGHGANQRLLGEKDGIDVLLQSVAYYKRRDPTSVDEIEMMENLFDCLCSALTFTPNRERFLQGEGLQLMILMLKEKKLSRHSSLKVLNHAVCSAEGADSCAKFVEVYGLRSLFPAFMKTPKQSKRVSSSEAEYEEHICSIIFSLFRNVRGPGRDRLISKFLESDHEKVDRLMELHFKYLKRVQAEDERIRREKKLSAEVETDDLEMESYMRRLDAGLYSLQLVDSIILELYLCSIPSIQGRISVLLGQHGESMATVKAVLQEYVENMGGEGAEESVKFEQKRIGKLLEDLKW